MFKFVYLCMIYIPLSLLEYRSQVEHSMSIYSALISLYFSNHDEFQINKS